MYVHHVVKNRSESRPLVMNLMVLIRNNLLDETQYDQDSFKFDTEINLVRDLQTRETHGNAISAFEGVLIELEMIFSQNKYIKVWKNVPIHVFKIMLFLLSWN